MGQFGSAQLRFFRQLCTAAKVRHQNPLPAANCNDLLKHHSSIPSVASAECSLHIIQTVEQLRMRLSRQPSACGSRLAQPSSSPPHAAAAAAVTAAAFTRWIQ
jgi:hypothetical protein